MMPCGHVMGLALKLSWRNRPRLPALLVGFLLVLVTLTFMLLASARYPPLLPSSCLGDPLSHEADPREVALYFTPRSKPVNEVVSSYLMQPHPKLCEEPLDLLVLVPSPPEDRQTRDIIRRTWGSVIKAEGLHTRSQSPPQSQPHSQSQPQYTFRRRRVGLLFMLGKKKGTEFSAMTALTEEGAEHGDVLIADFVDSYRNLTRKMLAGLNWISQHCASSTLPTSSTLLSPSSSSMSRRGALPAFVLKADQDAFVDVESLLDVLTKLQETQSMDNTLLGEMLCSERVRRDRESRVRVDTSLYPFSFYPPYVRGGTYIIPGGLLNRLVNASRYMTLLPVEDAFITGVLARSLRVQHMNLPRMIHGLVCPLSPCTFVDSEQLTVVSVDKPMMENIWYALQAETRLCRQHSSLWTRACVWMSRHWS